MNYKVEIEKLEEQIRQLKAKMQEPDVEIIQQVRRESLDQTDWQIGDLIRFTLTTGERVEAQCQIIDDKGAIFNLTHCLEEERPMNEEDTNEGGWDESDLRKVLNTEILDTFPEEIRQYMKPIYKDDLLTLPAIEDIFGEWDFDEWEPKEGAKPNWPPMEQVQHRAKGNWWWERSAHYNNAAYFCSVDTSGNANSTYASNSYGLAPAFRI